METIEKKGSLKREKMNVKEFLKNNPSVSSEIEEKIIEAYNLRK